MVMPHLCRVILSRCDERKSARTRPGRCTKRSSARSCSVPLFKKIAYSDVPTGAQKWRQRRGRRARNKIFQTFSLADAQSRFQHRGLLWSTTLRRVLAVFDHLLRLPASVRDLPKAATHCEKPSQWQDRSPDRVCAFRPLSLTSRQVP